MLNRAVQIFTIRKGDTSILDEEFIILEKKIQEMP